VSWPIVTLGQVTEINPCLPKGVDEDQQVSFLGMASVSVQGEITSEETRVLAETKKGFTYFERGDVLLAKITPCFENGKAVYTNSLKNPIGYGSTEFHVLRSKRDVLDAKYMFYMVWSDQFRFLGGKAMKGAAGQKRISADFLKEFNIPLPSLPEQKRIAAILDKADSLRRKNQQAIQLADQFLRAVFLDMFGDPVTNPKKLPIKKLESLIANKSDMVDGPFGSSVNTKIDYVENGEIPVIRTKNIGIGGEFIANDLKFMTRDKYESVKRSQVLPGDIVLTKVGTIGNVCIFPDTFKEAVLSTTGSCRIRVDEERIDKIYFYFFLRYYRPKMHEIASAGVQAFLNMQHIKGFEVPAPDLGEQRQFSKLVKSMMKLQKKQNYANMKPLFEVLSQKAFAGEL
jgi:type I restriction enzyme S subunit